MTRRRWLACSLCGKHHQVRPLYGRDYSEHAKDGRFARVAWLCDPCFAKLAGGGDVRLYRCVCRPGPVRGLSHVGRGTARCLECGRFCRREAAR